EATTELVRRAAKLRAGVDQLLLSALAEAATSWAGDAALLVDVERHGREPIANEADVSNTVGWFTAISPVLLRPGAPGEWGAALADIRSQSQQALHNGIGYGLLRYMHDDSTIRGSLEALPQAEISFNYLGRIDAALGGSTLFELSHDYAGATR